MPTRPQDFANSLPQSMNNRKTQSTETSEHLRLYSLAAAAAGVTVLSLAQPAEGEIIITNKTIPIHSGTPVMLDLNGDGINDFKFTLSNYTYKIASNNLLYVQGLTPGAANIGKGLAASAMVRSANIGPGEPFIHSDYNVFIELSRLCTQNCGQKGGYSFNQSLYGNWAGGHPNRFIGLKFKINGKVHYGWVRMTVTVKQKGTGKGPKGSFSATITEYGYESVANKSCGAGSPGTAVAGDQEYESKIAPSLGMLALGADGMALWRREETAVRQ